VPFSTSFSSFSIFHFSATLQHPVLADLLQFREQLRKPFVARWRSPVPITEKNRAGADPLFQAESAGGGAGIVADPPDPDQSCSSKR